MRKKRLGTNKSIPNKMMVKTLGNIIIVQILIFLILDIVLVNEGEKISFLQSLHYLFQFCADDGACHIHDPVHSAFR